MFRNNIFKIFLISSLVLFFFFYVVYILKKNASDNQFYPLTPKQINAFLDKEKINPLAVKNIGNYTVVLYETESEMGSYTLYSDRFGWHIQGKGNGDNNSGITPVSIAGRGSNGAAGRISFVTVIINDEVILNNADKVKVIFNNHFDTTDIINNKGLIIEIPVWDTNIKDLVIYDKNERILYQKN